MWKVAILFFQTNQPFFCPKFGKCLLMKSFIIRNIRRIVWPDYILIVFDFWGKTVEVLLEDHAPHPNM